eukprot:Skav212378  [mRNA]  locus=scaffold1983:157653:159377:+ [translate_table: standard]
MSGPFAAPSWWPGQTISLPGFPLQQLPNDDIRVAFCFSVVQHDKIRRCEDLRRSGHNSTIVASDVPHHHSVESFLAIARQYAEGHQTCLMWTQDLQGAYRQFPINCPDESFCAINTPSGIVLLRHHALMFGATASVWCFNRCADALAFVMRRLLAITLGHYVDDYIGLEPPLTVQSGFEEFTRLAAILGMKMKEVKARYPSQQQKILGVQMTISDENIIIAPQEDRVRRTCDSLRRALLADWLTPEEAQRIAGKLVFLTSTLFGQLGRAALKPFYGRSQGVSCGREVNKLNTPLRHAILFLLKLFAEIQPRVVPVRVHQPPAVLYTDAFFVMKGRVLKPGSDDIPTSWPTSLSPSFDNGLGLVFHNHCRPTFSHWRVPAFVLKAYCSRKAFIYFLEVLAQLVATLLIIKSDVTLLVSFIDNAPGRHALLRGYCNDPCICRLLAVYWRLVARAGLHIHMDWVPSSLNISDKVSRQDFSEMDFLQASWLQLQLDDLWNILVRVAACDEYAYGSAVDDLFGLQISTGSICPACTGVAEMVPVRSLDSTIETEGVCPASAGLRREKGLQSASRPNETQ